jgi:hypothetical protein
VYQWQNASARMNRVGINIDNGSNSELFDTGFLYVSLVKRENEVSVYERKILSLYAGQVW